MRAAAVGAAASVVDVDTFPNACGRGRIQIWALRPLPHPRPVADRPNDTTRAHRATNGSRLAPARLRRPTAPRRGRDGIAPAVLKSHRPAPRALDYDELADFVKHRMKMVHVFQPIMIRTLVEAGGSATDQDIARAFLSEDRAQLEYYTYIAKRWPRITLGRHGVVDYRRGSKGRRGVFTLNWDSPTDEQRRRIVELCNLRLQEYIDKNVGDLPWFDHLGAQSAIPGGIQYDVLARSGGVCVACGTPALKAPIHVDHIVPASRGGTDDPSNLQALCAKCNRAKRDKDATDFLLVQKRLKYSKRGCALCKARDVGPQNKLAVSIPSALTDAGRHWIIAPRSHVTRFSDLLPAQRNLCIDLIEPVKEHMRGSGCGSCEFDVRIQTETPEGGHFRIDVVGSAPGTAGLPQMPSQ